MSEDVTIGGLSFTPESFLGGHVRVVVRGHGREGQRPFLGNLTMTKTEWALLAGEAALWAAPRVGMLDLADNTLHRCGSKHMVTACRTFLPSVTIGPFAFVAERADGRCAECFPEARL